MMNASNFAIDLTTMESTFTQMHNAIEVAVKAALANNYRSSYSNADTGKNR